MKKTKQVLISIRYKEDKSQSGFIATYKSPEFPHKKKYVTNSLKNINDNALVDRTWGIFMGKVQEQIQLMGRQFSAIEFGIRPGHDFKSGHACIKSTYDKRNSGASKQSPAVKVSSRGPAGSNANNPAYLAALKAKAEISNSANELVSKMGHHGRARALLHAIAKEHGYDAVKFIKEEVVSIFEEMKEDFMAMERAKQEKTNKAAAILAMLKEQGLSLEDLQGTEVVKVAAQQTKAKAQAKAQAVVTKQNNIAARAAGEDYEIEDQGGRKVYWNGQGLAPEAFKLAFSQGKHLSHFRVEH